MEENVTPENAPVAAPEAPAQWDDNKYNEWYNSQPEQARMVIDRAVNEIEELRRVRGVVEPFQDLLADEEERKFLASLKEDPELRKFLRNDATEVYRSSRVKAQPAEPDPMSEIQSLKASIESERAERQAREYQEERKKEFEALAREAPRLARALKANNPNDPDYRFANHLIEMAESRSGRLGKKLSYKEVYDELQSYAAAEPPPAVPSTSPPGAARAVQAPTNEVESRARMKQVLERAGGFRKLTQVARP